MSRDTCSGPWCRIRPPWLLRLAAAGCAVALAAAGVWLLPGCAAAPAPTPTPSPTGGVTMGQLAGQGQAVFAQNCARCHGDKGQGVTAPALVGSGANLKKYNTAAGLLSFISTTMPMDRPGSLSSAQYQQVLGFLLVQNGFSNANTPFDTGTLGGIALK